jgi:hypothetical protein
MSRYDTESRLSHSTQLNTSDDDSEIHKMWHMRNIINLLFSDNEESIFYDIHEATKIRSPENALYFTK